MFLHKQYMQIVATSYLSVAQASSSSSSTDRAHDAAESFALKTRRERSAFHYSSQT